MSVSRQTIVRPIGLVRQPNQYGQYPDGALRLARNVVMRNPGELLQAPAITGTVQFAFANYIAQALLPLDQGHVYSLSSQGTTWWPFDNNTAGSIPALVSGTNTFSATGRITPVRARERALFNSAFGMLVGDSMAPTTAAQRALRMAGLPQVAWSSAAPTATDANVIPNNTMVGYTMCFMRDLGNDYKIRSVPMPAFKYGNISGSTTNMLFVVYWHPDSGVVAGDVIELYRTDGVATSGFIGYSGDPGPTFKLVQSYVLTASDISSSSVTITDSTSFTSGTLTTPGPELYTNPGQEGAVYANRQPPISACMASYKGYLFQGRTTDRPKWTFSCVGGFGSEINAIAQGVAQPYFKRYSLGRHSITGTYTNGSSNITGVSAADFVGLAVGQRYATGGPGSWSVITTTITALNSGAGTITMSAAANASAGPTNIQFDDVLELNGNVTAWQDLSVLLMRSQYDQATAAANTRGKWEITCSVTVPAEPLKQFISSATISYEPNRYGFLSGAGGGSFTVRGTNGARYSPPIPEIGATAQTISANTLKNHLVWSKEQQPEHVPSVLETFVGYAEIIALNSTRDALWIWCTDGLYRLSGDGGADGLGFRVDPVDTTTILAAPQASTVLNEIVYGYTNEGVVAFDSAGNKKNITEGRIADLLPGARYTETRQIIMDRNEPEAEVVLCLGENGNTFSDIAYVYNVRADGWTLLSNNNATLSNITALAMQRDPVSGDGRLLFGVSLLGGNQPQYGAWGSTVGFLDSVVEYQPIFGDDPLGLTQFIWADYLFAPGTANGKTITPTWNAVASGSATVQDIQNSGYARAGVPRDVAIAHSIAPGFQALSGTLPQSRFQGISVAMKTRSNQSKRV